MTQKQLEEKEQEFLEKLDDYGFVDLCETCKIKGCNQNTNPDKVWSFIEALIVQVEQETKEDVVKLLSIIKAYDNVSIEIIGSEEIIIIRNSSEVCAEIKSKYLNTKQDEK